LKLNWRDMSDEEFDAEVKNHFGHFEKEGTTMPIETFTTLQYSENREGPFVLYIFGHDGYHSGGQWFHKNIEGFEDEYITAREAMTRTLEAQVKKLEVRICDGGDMLVYHSWNGEVLYPKPADGFWREVAGV
jgi:hypothetical protein